LIELDISVAQPHQQQQHVQEMLSSWVHDGTWQVRMSSAKLTVQGRVTLE
jgi:hypothetical protein